ncbi:MAG: hypothetical protein ACOYMG_29070, partial [Candidatus Methylumidiphilus sp.]
RLAPIPTVDAPCLVQCKTPLQIAVWSSGYPLLMKGLPPGFIARLVALNVVDRILNQCRPMARDGSES